MAEQIYSLIGKAMRKIGAIGKDSVNAQQGFKYRGIDAVYNALNPVMSELGLFVCPEILDHRREERESIKVYNGKETKTILKYSILTIKYTVFAPDGSNVSLVVVGEGMDSGDKASNKALSVAMKYAMFQLFMIPTEESESVMIDPDSECHTVVSPAKTPTAPKAAKSEQVTTSKKLPETVPPVLEYLAKERENLMKARGISKAENAVLWTKQIEVLKENGLIPNKALSAFTMAEAEHMVQFMYARFDECGTELKPDDGNIK